MKNKKTDKKKENTMKSKQAIAILGKDASKEKIDALILSVKTEAKVLSDEETKGLLENKEKLLTQMGTLKKNQLPEGWDQKKYDDYAGTRSSEFPGFAYSR